MENVCLAVAIAPIKESLPTAGEKGHADVHTINGYFEATGTGYSDVRDPTDWWGFKKRIPYKVYVPDDGLNVGGTAGRGYADWPLDVIIFSHGAGMNRDIGSGVPGGSVDGIAKFWAKKGYIVVAPTYRKRHGLTLPLGPRWEEPYEYDSIAKAFTDAGNDGDPSKVGQFYADRLRDLKTIADNLDTIVNQNVNSATWGAYDPAISNVALAGHSLGAVTTILASGILWKKGDVVLDMEAAPYNFRRVNNGGTPTNIADDSGPFIDAEAFLDISETTFDGVEVVGPPRVQTIHTLLDASRRNLTGRDMISKPFMLIAGSNDILADWYGNLTSNVAVARLYDPVIQPFGLHDAARYGVIIDGANHLTAVGQFDIPGTLAFRSWDLDAIWTNWVLPLNGSGQLMPEEEAFFDVGSFLDRLEDTINAIFFDVNTTQAAEEARASEIQTYSLAFWDAYLSNRYDLLSGMGSDFLGEPESVHRDRQYVYDVGNVHGFVRRDPTHAFVVRDNTGTPLVQFQNDGNILISSGTISVGSVTTNSLVSEFIVKAPSGTNLMKIDSGGLRIKGSLFNRQLSVSAGAAREFIIRDVSDAGSTARIILNEYGSLRLLGTVYTPAGQVP